MVELIIILVLLGGAGFGLYLFLKAPAKAVEPTPVEEEEHEVIMAEEYNVIDESQDGSRPKDGVALSDLEASLIDADEEAMDELKKGEQHLAVLRELKYKIGAENKAQGSDERREDVVEDTEEDGLKYYPADGQGGQDPFEYQPHNI
jgi:hypothetical protein